MNKNTHFLYILAMVVIAVLTASYVYLYMSNQNLIQNMNTLRNDKLNLQTQVEKLQAQNLQLQEVTQK